MQLRPDELPVDSEQPFEHDAFSRKEIAESMARLLRNTAGPYVVSLDAPWGSGKTTFLRMLRVLLGQSGFASLYFNAWETDFSDDPLVAFMGELDGLFTEEFPSEASKREKFEKAKKIANAVLKRAIPAAVKVATVGAIDISDEIGKVAEELGGGLADDAIASYIKSRGMISDFRARITEAIGEISSSRNNLPVVIIVDELDRCRPLYAIELLERIKHLFNIPNALFIVATDRDQLGISLGAVYGQGFNSREYLRRFFDLDLRLASVANNKFFDSLSRRMNLQAFFDARPQGVKNSDLATTKWAFEELSWLFQMTPRMQEHFMALLVLAMKSTENGKYFCALQTALLAALKICDERLYHEVTRQEATVTKIIDKFKELQGERGMMPGNHWHIVEGAILALARHHDHKATELIRKHNQIAKEDSENGDMNASHIVISAISSHEFCSTNLKTLSGRIDIAHQISVPQS